jgi:hypothetical protein
MKPFFALVIAAGMSAAGLLFAGASAEAAFFSGSGMAKQPLVLPVQEYNPGIPQTSRARCRCYPGYPQPRLVCRYPGGRTTVQYVRPRECQYQ